MQRALLFFVACVLVAFASTASAADCVCLNGGTRNVTTTLPNRCECTCTSGWYPPVCEYKNDTLVKVRIDYVNSTAIPYKASSLKIQSLYGRHGIPYGNSSKAIKMVRRLTDLEPADKAIIIAIVNVQGVYVDRVLRDFELNGPDSTYYKGLGVLKLYLYLQEPSSPSVLSQSVLLGNTPWAAMSWCVGGGIMLFAFPILECILGACCKGTTFCAPSEAELAAETKA